MLEIGKKFQRPLQRQELECQTVPDAHYATYPSERLKHFTYVYTLFCLQGSKQCKSGSKFWMSLLIDTFICERALVYQNEVGLEPER